MLQITKKKNGFIYPTISNSLTTVDGYSDSKVFIIYIRINLIAEKLLFVN